MSKVIDFSNQNKSSEENLLSEANPEINNVPKCSRDCPQFNSCSAPLCPADADSLKNGIFYPNEDVCQLRAFSNLDWVRRQKRIAVRSKNPYFYFTLKMLCQNCIIRGGIEGLDPDATSIDETAAVKSWLKAHPEKKEVSKAEKAEMRRNFLINVKGGVHPSEKEAIRPEN